MMGFDIRTTIWFARLLRIVVRPRSKAEPAKDETDSFKQISEGWQRLKHSKWESDAAIGAEAIELRRLFAKFNENLASKLADLSDDDYNIDRLSEVERVARGYFLVIRDKKILWYGDGKIAVVSAVRVFEIQLLIMIKKCAYRLHDLGYPQYRERFDEENLQQLDNDSLSDPRFAEGGPEAILIKIEDKQEKKIKFDSIIYDIASNIFEQPNSDVKELISAIPTLAAEDRLESLLQIIAVIEAWETEDQRLDLLLTAAELLPLLVPDQAYFRRPTADQISALISLIKTNFSFIPERNRPSVESILAKRAQEICWNPEEAPGQINIVERMSEALSDLGIDPIEGNEIIDLLRRSVSFLPT